MRHGMVRSSPPTPPCPASASSLPLPRPPALSPRPARRQPPPRGRV